MSRRAGRRGQRRGSSLGTRLTRALVGLGLASVVLLATVNFFVVRDLLDRSTRAQLETLRELRIDEIELAIDDLLTRISVLSADPAVAVALSELEGAYQTIDVALDDAQLDLVDETYLPVVEPYDAAGVDRPPIAELVPSSAAGRYLQYHYVAANTEAARSDLIVAPGDASAYGAVHAEHHAHLRRLADDVGASDLLLVGRDTGDVVYSVDKRVDLGTDVDEGPHADTGLGAVVDALDNLAVEEAAIADTSFYLPDTTAPVVHVAAAVRSDSEVVGALVVTLRTERLTDIVTAGQQWELLGLGDTGDAYVVGSDHRLRTVPRLWFEDPAGYVDRVRSVTGDDRVAELMQFTGSPVLIHTVDNDAVRAARTGERFVGRVSDHLGRPTVAASGPLDVGSLGWVVVTERGADETDEDLVGFVSTIAIVVAVLLAALVVLGVLLARALARPVGPLVASAERIAGGDYGTPVPDLGRNELGDVANQLDAVARQLAEQEATIAAEEQRIRGMLATVLPPALAEQVRRGERDLAEDVDTATVVAVRVRGIPVPAGAELDAVAELRARIAEVTAETAAQHQVERLQVTLAHQLFVAGRGQPGVAAPSAATFAAEVVAAIGAAAAENGLDVSVGAGLSAGRVATGVVGSRHMAFGVWGAPVSAATELSTRAGPGQLLADRTVVDELGDGWTATALAGADAHAIVAPPVEEPSHRP